MFRERESLSAMLYRNEKKIKRSEKGRFALARQITIEYYNCDERPLLDKDYIENAMLTAAKESGATEGDAVMQLLRDEITDIMSGHTAASAPTPGTTPNT